MYLPEIIKTDRCIISLISERDVEWLYSTINETDILQFLPGMKIFAGSEVDTTNFIIAMKIAHESETGCLWKISYKNENCGYICLIDLEDNPSCSYVLNKKFRKKGIMYECLSHLFMYFEPFETKIQIDVNINNITSLRLSHKLALKFKHLQVSYSSSSNE